MTDPYSTYSELLPKRRAEIARIENRQRTFGYWRLAVAALAALIVWLALSAERISIAWLAAPIAAFIVLMIVHDRLAARRRSPPPRRALLRTGAGPPRRQMDRQRAKPGDQYLDPAHPYAQDLDLFGKGSLFELLCTARTHIGEDTLARWLLVPAAPPDGARAQRRRSTSCGPAWTCAKTWRCVAEEARTGVDPVALAAWGEAPRAARSQGAARPALGPHGCSACCGLAALFAMASASSGSCQLSDTASPCCARRLPAGGWWSTGFSCTAGGANSSAVVAARGRGRARTRRCSREVLVRLEREQFQSPLLARLRAVARRRGRSAVAAPGAARTR